MTQKKELFDEQLEILSGSEAALRKQLQTAEAQIINATLLPQQLQETIAVKAAKCKSLQVRVKNIHITHNVCSTSDVTTMVL